MARTIPTISLRHRLRIALEESSVSVDEMAERLARHRNTITNYIHGHTKPTERVLRVWAEQTGVDLAWLAGDDYPNVVVDLRDTTPDEGESYSAWLHERAEWPTTFDESFDLLVPDLSTTGQLVGSSSR